MTNTTNTTTGKFTLRIARVVYFTYFKKNCHTVHYAKISEDIHLYIIICTRKHLTKKLKFFLSCSQHKQSRPLNCIQSALPLTPSQRMTYCGISLYRAVAINCCENCPCRCEKMWSYEGAKLQKAPVVAVFHLFTATNHPSPTKNMHTYIASQNTINVICTGRNTLRAPHPPDLSKLLQNHYHHDC